jgi:hypothetical protein
MTVNKTVAALRCPGSSYLVAFRRKEGFASK